MIIVPIATLVAQARALRDLLKDKKRWIQGTPAENSHGAQVNPTDPNACKFCLVGGVQHVTGGSLLDHPLALLLANAIRGKDESDGRLLAGFPLTIKPTQVKGHHIYSYNDCRTHAEVMEVVDTAVAVAEGAEAAGVRF